MLQSNNKGIFGGCRFWPHTLTHPYFSELNKSYCVTLKMSFPWKLFSSNPASLSLFLLWFCIIEFMYSLHGSSPSQMLCQKPVLKNFGKRPRKATGFFDKIVGLQPTVCNVIKKETPELVFPCKFWKISHNGYSAEQVLTIISTFAGFSLKKIVICCYSTGIFRCWFPVDTRRRFSVNTTSYRRWNDVVCLLGYSDS